MSIVDVTTDELRQATVVIKNNVVIKDRVNPIHGQDLETKCINLENGYAIIYCKTEDDHVRKYKIGSW